MIQSPEGRAFLQTQEGGFRSVPYPDSGGVMTWGYGHACGPHEVVPVSCTLAQADALYAHDVAGAEDDVNRILGSPDVPQHVFDALVSFLYNVGLHALRAPPHRTLDAIRARDWKLAGQRMLTWCHDNGVRVEGLYNRRLREVAMLLA